MIRSFVSPERKLVRPPSSFASTWQPDVYSEALHKMAILTHKFGFLTAKLFEPMSEVRASCLRDEIRQIKTEMTQLIKSVCNDRIQMVQFTMSVMSEYGQSDYLTMDQKAMLEMTGMSAEILKL